LQGDVIAILNKDAKTVAEYSYDAWGAITSAVTDTKLTKGVDIETINPFNNVKSVDFLI
jgi:YD repeat-containing protein